MKRLNYKQKMRIAVFVIGIMLIIAGAGEKLAPLHPVLSMLVNVVHIVAFIGGAVCIYQAVRNG
jgi:hypothetical protein